MWWSYEEFVYMCGRAFKMRTDGTGPRPLDPRFRIRLHRTKHRHQGRVALGAVTRARKSLERAEGSQRRLCYVPQVSDQHNDGPPTKPANSRYNTNALSPGEQADVANCLQDFRDSLAAAVGIVGAYQAKLSNDAERRQRWFDNAIKLVTVATALGKALAPI
ncbi:uncharacterized protein BDW43DRAFT_263608 [Aspergillus alliaceus]|uniref:uncharacterized protein n=1 Tax=Petromyces alliaceus TaxID=209559 RepID=UPI0012A58AEE|nr:uncharacterized protein BDW43DRAFT_263608 [Aspergillus alliaceus]KAB8237542.1 hypothetical protein BDW43DRAFT_263608 [Aspergillus alliaceus]